MLTQAQISTLVADSVCINSCIPQGMQLAVLIYLASQIVANGGTGGGGTGTPDFITVAGPPTNTPGATDSHIVVDSNGQQWQYYAGAWS